MATTTIKQAPLSWKERLKCLGPGITWMAAGAGGAGKLLCRIRNFNTIIVCHSYPAREIVSPLSNFFYIDLSILPSNFPKRIKFRIGILFNHDLMSFFLRSDAVLPQSK